MSFKLKLNTKFRALLSAGNATFQHQCRCIFVFLMLMLQVIDQIFVCVKSSNFFLPKLPVFFTFLYIYNYYVYRPDPDYDARQIHSTDWQSFREVLSVSQLDSLVPPRNQNYRGLFLSLLCLCPCIPAMRRSCTLIKVK